MNKQFWKAALNRAVRTVCQTLASTLPIGVTVTAEMVKGFSLNVIWAILAWLATGLLGGVASILTSIGWGIPEAEEPQKDGSPIVGHDFPDEGGDDSCDKCDLSAYVDGGEDDAGDALSLPGRGALRTLQQQYQRHTGLLGIPVYRDLADLVGLYVEIWTG